jgi:hypothetical protein
MLLKMEDGGSMFSHKANATQKQQYFSNCKLHLPLLECSTNAFFVVIAYEMEVIISNADKILLPSFFESLQDAVSMWR